METDELLLPKQKMSVLEKVSITYHIKDVMGRDLPSPAINTEDFEGDWHLFELKIVAKEPRD